MASLTQIAAAQLVVSAHRLKKFSAEVTKLVPEDLDDSLPEHRAAASLIDQLAKDVDAAILKFNSALLSHAAALAPKPPTGDEA